VCHEDSRGVGFELRVLSGAGAVAVSEAAGLLELEVSSAAGPGRQRSADDARAECGAGLAERRDSWIIGSNS